MFCCCCSETRARARCPPSAPPLHRPTPRGRAVRRAAAALRRGRRRRRRRHAAARHLHRERGRRARRGARAASARRTTTGGYVFPFGECGGETSCSRASHHPPRRRLLSFFSPGTERVGAADDAQWRRMLDANCYGAFRTINEVSQPRAPPPPRTWRTFQLRRCSTTPHASHDPREVSAARRRLVRRSPSRFGASSGLSGRATRGAETHRPPLLAHASLSLSLSLSSRVASDSERGARCAARAAPEAAGPLAERPPAASGGFRRGATD